MVFNTIKLELDCKKQYEKAIDSLTSKQVAFWLNNNLKFKLYFFDNGDSFELSSATKIYLGIKAMNGFGEISDSFDILKEIDVSTTSSNSIDIEISSSDISMKMTAGLKWLVVYAEDSNGGFLTFFGGKIICQNDASDGVASGESINRIEKYVKENIGKISEALEDAKAKINTWSEQTERFAQNEANISALFASKANSGALHFYGGNIQCSGLANKPIPNVNSIAFRWKCDNNTYSKIDKNQRVFGYSASGGLSWYHLTKVLGGALQWYVKYEDNSQQYVSVTTATWESLIDGDWHNVEFISTGTAFEIWVDGVLKQSVARNNTSNFATPASNFVVSYASSNIGEVADFCFFNFDMSADDAPYTINDYQQNKPITPSLLSPTAEQRAELALENFTFNGEVLDYSGNGRHCTISGAVAGDNDRKVETLFEKFSARIANQTNG